VTHPLQAILEPRSVAVIGASSDAKKRGHQALRALQKAGFRGPIYPVHPDGGELLGLAVATSIDQLGDSPELAFVATRAKTVPGILELCGKAGVQGVVVPAAGFKESDPDGAELEREVAAAAERNQIRVIGPNTSGILNTAIGLNLVGVEGVPTGGLAIVAHSGNVGLALMTEAASLGCGISVYIGIGNECDVTFHECLEYLVEEPQTRAILMYVEGFRDGSRFLEVASRVSRTKPIVVLRGGRREPGREAARSHTGAVAGAYAVFQAAMRQAGVIEVERADELLSVGMTLAEQPPIPIGTGVAVLADGGGHATLAADALSTLSVPRAELSNETQARLRSLLGPGATVRNPVDLAGRADTSPEIFTAALELILGDPAVGGVFTAGLFGGYALRFADELAEPEASAANAMVEISRVARRPLVVHTLFARHRTEALERLSAAGIVVVESLEIGVRCIAASSMHGQIVGEAESGGLPEPPSVTPDPATTVRESSVIVTARSEGRTTLTEPEARKIASAAGVPIVAATWCRSAEEAARVADELDGPVAVKAVSATVSHKTDAGGVALDLIDGRAARQAYSRVTAAVQAYAASHSLEPDVRGVLVSSMLEPPIAELLIGVRRDPEFGPVVVIGPGGVTAELFGDPAIRVLPVTPDEVATMFSDSSVTPILGGYRGRPSADREALIDLALSLVACFQSDPGISEIEVNPVFAYSDSAIAVDIRAFLDASTPSCS
jgi:acetyltransferase